MKFGHDVTRVRVAGREFEWSGHRNSRRFHAAGQPFVLRRNPCLLDFAERTVKMEAGHIALPWATVKPNPVKLNTVELNIVELNTVELNTGCD